MHLCGCRWFSRACLCVYIYNFFISSISRFNEDIKVRIYWRHATYWYCAMNVWKCKLCESCTKETKKKKRKVHHVNLWTKTKIRCKASISLYIYMFILTTYIYLKISDFFKWISQCLAATCFFFLLFLFTHSPDQCSVWCVFFGSILGRCLCRSPDYFDRFNSHCSWSCFSCICITESVLFYATLTFYESLVYYHDLNHANSGTKYTHKNKEQQKSL